DEYDEPEPELPLVCVVELGELTLRRRISRRALFAPRTERQRSGVGADARMGVEDRDLLDLGHARERSASLRDDRTRRVTARVTQGRGEPWRALEHRGKASGGRIGCHLAAEVRHDAVARDQEGDMLMATLKAHLERHAAEERVELARTKVG